MIKNTVILLIILTFKHGIKCQSTESILNNSLHHEDLKTCLRADGKPKDVGTCLGRELLYTLNKYDEKDRFSLVNGVAFVRDEKAPRDFGSFLDFNPLDLRSIMDGASNIISQRSLHWDLSRLYPGLSMRIAPTLANGVLEFIMDPRYQDRTFEGEMTTGRLLAKNLLLPFLLGFKFKISTLLPILLGLILLASKKAFLLSKVAIAAATIFGSSTGAGYAANNGYYPGPEVASYTQEYTAVPPYLHGPPNHLGHHEHTDYYSHHRPQQAEYFLKEKSPTEEVTGSPITPVELRERLERLFVTKKDNEKPKDLRPGKARDSRRFVWEDNDKFTLA